jgi:hypothetical protein
MRVPRPLLPALILIMVMGGLAALPALPRAHAAPADVLGVPLPPGTRIDPARAPGAASDPASGERRHLFVSGRGFRATVEFYQRFLARRGLQHQAIPVYRYRGTEIARFLSRQPGTAWSAVHVYRDDARTWIFIVPQPLDPSHDPR